MLSVFLLGACGGDDDTSDRGPDDDGSTCIDEAYTETLPSKSADIGAISGAYSSGDVEGFIVDVLAMRYPVGEYLVSSALEENDDDCIDTFIDDTSSAEAVIDQLSTIVHECGHFLDNARSTSSADELVITPTTSFSCADGDTTDRFGNTFARSLLNGDDFSALRPPCGGNVDGDCDFYGDIYLDGDPNDGTFDSGDQGFNLLLEESVQYVNSLATAYAFADHYSVSVTERDGILTFLWYIERYLHLARTEHQDVYDFLINDTCFTEAILTVWGRAWLYLDATEGNSKLGLFDDAILELVNDATLLDEIERVRAATGCRG